MSALLAQARLRACRYWPFASHAILSMIPVPRPGLGTLAVDQHWRLYFDEATLQRMSIDQAAGLILHELDHLLKRHHKRAKGLVGDVGRLRNMLAFIDAAASLDELRVPPNFGLHPLTGDRNGTWAMTVTRNWRLTFALNAAGALIDMDLEDYHGA